MAMQSISGFLALFVCLAALPIVKLLSQRFSLYDAPGPLKIHHGPIPRIGGIAMFAGFVAGSVILYIPSSRPNSLPFLLFAIVWAVGLTDDIKTLGSSFRLFMHITTGAAFWFAGWRLRWFDSPLFDLLVTCLFVAFLINAMNLLDGMDGLAAGTAAIVCIGFLTISSSEANALEITVASSLLGACVGMLSINAPPATMFMGDSGSTLIGIVLAFLSLNWVRVQSDPHRILIPLIFLSVPIADALLAILRRALSHKLPFQGDRRHFYDILLQRGWTADRVLKLSVAMTGVLVFVGWLCARGVAGTWITSSAVLCSLAAIAYLLGSLKSDSKPARTAGQETSLGSVLE
jgi:UDP-GlcNAc:undecaprenyl-phosphate/decaprenyl-phosphate GlcNAc-1-phosphate transferase